MKTYLVDVTVDFDNDNMIEFLSQYESIDHTCMNTWVTITEEELALAILMFGAKAFEFRMEI